MQRSARPWFIGALFGVVTMAVTWYLSHEVPVLRRVDVEILQGFLQVRRPILEGPAHALTSWFDPAPFVALSVVPVTVALRRGRRDVAVAILVLLLGANLTTEILKPLTAGPRAWIGGVPLGHATWPSGHSTASMSLALAMIICAPQRLRPIVASLMAALVVGVVYSLLTLGWHYPSDVLGGFEEASTWALLVVGAVRMSEARRGSPVPRVSRPSERFSLTATLLPSAVLLVGALGVGAALTAARPLRVIGFAAAHPAFMTGAPLIAILSFACASGLSLLLRRPAGPPGSGRAPTEAPRPRPGRSPLG